MEVPLPDDTGDRYSPYSPYHAPSPDPYEGDKEDKPAGIRADVKNPGVLARMPPIANGAETNEEGEEGDRGNREDAEKEGCEQEKRRIGEEEIC